MMSSLLEQPDVTNEPIWEEPSMKKNSVKMQLGGAGEQTWSEGAPDSQLKMSGGAGVQQSAATSHLCEAQQAAETER